MPTAPVHHGWAAIQAMRLDAVVQLLLEVLVEENPVRLAGSAQVDAHARVPVPGEVGVHGGVAPPGPVVLPVGDVLEDRGHRFRLGALGKPDLRGQAASVRQRNPDVLDLAHLARKIRANPHASPSHGARCPRRLVGRAGVVTGQAALRLLVARALSAPRRGPFNG